MCRVLHLERGPNRHWSPALIKTTGTGPGSGRDDDHLAGRALRHLRRDAPEEQASEVRPASRAEHDDIGAFGGGRIEDGLRRVALPDQVGRLDAGCPRPGDDLADPGFETVALLVDPAR